jgi:hypothetical protein
VIPFGTQLLLHFIMWVCEHGFDKVRLLRLAEMIWINSARPRRLGDRSIWRQLWLRLLNTTRMTKELSVTHGSAAAPGPFEPCPRQYLRLRASRGWLLTQRSRWNPASGPPRRRIQDLGPAHTCSSLGSFQAQNVSNEFVKVEPATKNHPTCRMEFNRSRWFGTTRRYCPASQ